MSDTPDPESLVMCRVDGIYRGRMEKVAGEVCRPSSRGQKDKSASCAAIKIPRLPDCTWRESYCQIIHELCCLHMIPNRVLFTFSQTPPVQWMISKEMYVGCITWVG